ncbi:MAG: hypothetical protein R2780_02240 [Crocinitomicaceae bacterium]|nr:hypothetical protein [Crocinitomicaceae bacterium]
MKKYGDYLNFYKTILDKVSFDTGLFWKEYQKALKFLSNEEKQELDLWIKEHLN